MGHLALVVDSRGASLSASTHQTLTLTHADGRTERVGMLALSSVVVHGDVALSTGVLQRLAANQVALVVMPGRGCGPSVGFTQWPARHAALRHAQHLAHAKVGQRLALARIVVLAKLTGMEVFRRRWLAVAPPVDEAATHLAVAEAVDIATLMGVEGAASARHMALLGQTYGEGLGFQFTGRNRRPPRDPANALMSLCYTLAEAEAARLAARTGLDLQLGLLHGLHRDRRSLALDLIEPARPVIDGWVQDLLLGHRIDVAGHFTPAMGAQLNAAGRARLYPLWFAEGLALARGPMRGLLARILATLRCDGADAATVDEGAPALN